MIQRNLIFFGPTRPSWLLSSFLLVPTRFRQFRQSSDKTPDFRLPPEVQRSLRQFFLHQIFLIRVSRHTSKYFLPHRHLSMSRRITMSQAHKTEISGSDRSKPLLQFRNGSRKSSAEQFWGLCAKRVVVWDHY